MKIAEKERDEEKRMGWVCELTMERKRAVDNDTQTNIKQNRQ